MAGCRVTRLQFSLITYSREFVSLSRGHFTPNLLIIYTRQAVDHLENNQPNPRKEVPSLTSRHNIAQVVKNSAPNISVMSKLVLKYSGNCEEF